MGLTVYLALIALALLVLAAVLLIQGVRRRSRARLFAAAAMILILLAGYAALVEFITRM